MNKILLIFSGFVVVGSLLISPFVIKVKIECKSQFGVCPAGINAGLQKIIGRSIFAAKRDVSKLLKSDYSVSDFSTQYKLPNTLALSILVKKPDFAIYSKATSQLVVVDEEGTVLAVADSSTLPKIIIESEAPKTGQKVGIKILNALELIRGVWNMYQVGSGDANEEALTVALPGNIDAILPLEGDAQVTLGALRVVYTRITTGDLIGKYSQIDLRFKNPVLR